MLQQPREKLPEERVLMPGEQPFYGNTQKMAQIITLRQPPAALQFVIIEYVFPDCPVQPRQFLRRYSSPRMPECTESQAADPPVLVIYQIQYQVHVRLPPQQSIDRCRRQSLPERLEPIRRLRPIGLYPDPWEMAHPHIFRNGGVDRRVQPKRLATVQEQIGRIPAEPFPGGRLVFVISPPDIPFVIVKHHELPPVHPGYGKGIPVFPRSHRRQGQEKEKKP